MQDLGLDFNDLFILECFSSKDERQYFDMFSIPSIKDFNLSSRFQWLRKEEYLVDNPEDSSKLIISKKGKNFLEEIYLPEPIRIGNVSTSLTVLDFDKTEDEMFEEWWKTYPSTTSWMSDDKKTKFTGSRALRNLKKSDAKKRYIKLLNQGLSHDELLGGLKYEIKTKKLDSIKKDVNQMDYFKGMEAYFNSERYMIYLESYREYPDFVSDTGMKGKSKNVTDI